MSLMEVKYVNENTILYNGDVYKAKGTRAYSCVECAFFELYDKDCKIKCTPYERDDKRNVIFKKSK